MAKAIAHRYLWIDSMGAWVSLSCAVHCAALPVLFGILPLIGLGFLAQDRFEKVLLTLSVALALTSLSWGYRSHRRWSGLLILVCGLVLILIGRNLVGEGREILFVVTGVVLVAGAHILNRHLCHRCQDCDH
jgi:hypothetical protein